MRRVLFFAAISFLFPVSAFCAPYLGKELEFHQPDGSPIAVRVWGDEFYIRAETLDGYSLVRDPVSGFICYAEINNDESDFVSTGIPYTGQTVEKLKNSGLWPLAQGNGIKKGLRLKRQAVLEKADRNRHLLGRDQRGRILPAPDSDAFSAASAQAGSPAPLIGEVVGLTLLIQFPDVPATIPQADIYNYCNQAGYTGYGNNGSVRDYFYDVSNGNLTYTNYVTVYYTAQNNRSYYTDPAISYGTRARELIQEALLWLDNPSGQNFNFGTISTDASNYMLAINAFYAGPIVNNWAEGLWPHMSSMYGMFTSNEGVKSGVYQITNIGSSLVLGTFCHENGHMICGYPDLYDYGYDSYGAGNFCLMAYGGSSNNPVPPNPYFRDIKGWESVTELPHLSGVQYFLQSNTNNSCKYLNPNNPEEFFYIDSRTKTGRNSSLPDDGLVIWHIDENGSNDNQQMTPSLHYLVSVEQADGSFHLEYEINPGGSGDLFHAGYKDIFNDTTNPNAKWWNGANSNLVIRQISAVGSTMSFVYDDYGSLPHPPVAQECSVQTQINTPVPITLVATDEGLPNPPGDLNYIITSLPSHGNLSDPNAGGIGAVPYTLAGRGDRVIYTPATDYGGTDSFTFKANDGGVPPDGGDSNQATVFISVANITTFLTENFEAAFVSGAPPGWTKSFKTSTLDWIRNSGDYRNNGAHGGSYNALLYISSTGNHETYLITPAINFPLGTQAATLEFWHKQAYWNPDQDTLTVYYKTSAGGIWTELASYTTDVPLWTKRTISLPNPGSNYYIGFLGNAKYGYGVCIDDVSVTGVIPQMRTLTISSTSGGHTEPSAGGHQYASGTVVNINAIPDSYYQFVNWTGSGVTEGKVANPNAANTTITVDANLDVTANFTLSSYTLSVNSNGASGVEISSSTGHEGITNYTKTVIYGTTVALTAPSTAEGNDFTGWTGDINDNNQTISFAMNGDRNVTANFPTLTPVLHPEPNITPGLCNKISWDPVPQAKAYYAECSSDPCFLVVDYNSSWITRTSYQFCDLNECEKYWYRVKSGLSAWSQTNQEEFQSDTLTDTTATIGGDIILFAGGTDTVGNTNYFYDMGTDGYFNGFLVTTATTIMQIEIYLGISTSRSIEFVVYEGGVSFFDQYNRIHSSTLASSGTGTKFYTSGPISVPLQAGRHYMIGAVCSGSTKVYYDEIDSSPTFGNHIGWGYSGFPSSDNLTDIGNDPVTFYHRYTTGQLGGGYKSPGNVVSTPVNLPAGGNWGIVDFNETTPIDTALTVDILPATGSIPITGYDNVPIGSDLGGISDLTIRLHANLSTSDSNSTPALHDWSVTYTDPAGIESDWSNIESSIQVIPGDFEPDCDVDWHDFAVLANQWLQPPGTPSADIAPLPEGNGMVDYLDLAEFAAHWLEGI